MIFVKYKIPIHLGVLVYLMFIVFFFNVIKNSVNRYIVSPKKSVVCCLLSVDYLLSLQTKIKKWQE